MHLATMLVDDISMLIEIVLLILSLISVFRGKLLKLFRIEDRENMQKVRCYTLLGTMMLIIGSTFYLLMSHWYKDNMYLPHLYIISIIIGFHFWGTSFRYFCANYLRSFLILIDHKNIIKVLMTTIKFSFSGYVICLLISYVISAFLNDSRYLILSVSIVLYYGGTVCISISCILFYLKLQLIGSTLSVIKTGSNVSEEYYHQTLYIYKKLNYLIIILTTNGLAQIVGGALFQILRLNEIKYDSYRIPYQNNTILRFFYNLFLVTFNALLAYYSWIDQSKISHFLIQSKNVIITYNCDVENVAFDVNTNSNGNNYNRNSSTTENSNTNNDHVDNNNNNNNNSNNNNKISNTNDIKNDMGQHMIINVVKAQPVKTKFDHYLSISNVPFFLKMSAIPTSIFA